MIAVFSNKSFLIKICPCFRHSAIAHVTDYSTVYIGLFYALGSQKKTHVTCFILVLLYCGGLEPKLQYL